MEYHRSQPAAHYPQGHIGLESSGQNFLGQGGMNTVAQDQSQQLQIEEAREGSDEQQEMFFEEFEEEDVGTSPINLPDPSVFSDLGENGAQTDQLMPP